MTTKNFFKDKNLDNSFVLGFYGGTNYGDELLLEVIQYFLQKKGYQNISLYYSHPELFDTYHHNYGYTLSGSSKISLIKMLFKHKKIILGGGGFWGLDFGLSTFFMSVYLFIARYIFFKEVHLIGVGYYDSASKFARLGAFFAGLGANTIIARDQYTFDNFSKVPFSKNKISLDADIAFSLIQDISEKDFLKDITALEKYFEKNDCNFEDDLTILGLRRFSNGTIERRYFEIVSRFLKNKKNISILAFEDINQFKDHYGRLLDRQIVLSDANVINYTYNPVALYFFLRKHKAKIDILTPQFHVIMVAALADVKYYPVSYDYKVSSLLSVLGREEDKLYLNT